MSLDTIIGTLIGATITLLAIYLTHRFSEKREMQKLQMEHEKDAISQVFSPLVFILEKARELFARIGALHSTISEMSESDDGHDEVPILEYFTLKGAMAYPNALEDILMHKSGLIKSRQFYSDLVVFQSYLSTIVGLLALLLSKNKRTLPQLRRCISSFGPLLIQLDEAIGGMRKYSMTRTSGLRRYEYKHFFTEQKFSECEGYINEINREITGEDVVDWSLRLKELSGDYFRSIRG